MAAPMVQQPHLVQAELMDHLEMASPLVTGSIDLLAETFVPETQIDGNIHRKDTLYSPLYKLRFLEYNMS
ncbi:MAG: hypothetical protein N3B21_02100 [Clostridia bacterium]|nr:hypothetical protein [Clostridia bacterium]